MTNTTVSKADRIRSLKQRDLGVIAATELSSLPATKSAS